MVKLVLTLALVVSASALPQLGLDNFISGGDSGFISSGGDSGFISSGGDVGFSSGGNIGFSSGGNVGFSSGGVSSGSGDQRLHGISFNDGCSGGQVRHADGNCVTPEVSTDMFLYAVPAQVARTVPATNLPKPKVQINHVFVRTDNANNVVRPVIGPVPKQKTIVYVLNKRPDAAQQEVIEVPYTPTRPEVFVVNFDDESDNRQLHGGVDLQTALRQSLANAQVIEAGGSSNTGGSVASIGGGSISGGSISGGSISGGSISGGSISGGVIDGGNSFIGGGDIINSGDLVDNIF